jgi:hypothetical protein
MIFLAHKLHTEIAEAVEMAFSNIGTPALIRILPLDTQGIVISMMQTHA